MILLNQLYFIGLFSFLKKKIFLNVCTKIVHELFFNGKHKLYSQLYFFCIIGNFIFQFKQICFKCTKKMYFLSQGKNIENTTRKICRVIEFKKCDCLKQYRSLNDIINSLFSQHPFLLFLKFVRILIITDIILCKIAVQKIQGVGGPLLDFF